MANFDFKFFNGYTHACHSMVGKCQLFGGKMVENRMEGLQGRSCMLPRHLPYVFQQGALRLQLLKVFIGWCPYKSRFISIFLRHWFVKSFVIARGYWVQETEMQILIAHSREVVCFYKSTFCFLWDCSSFQVNEFSYVLRVQCYVPGLSHFFLLSLPCSLPWTHLFHGHPKVQITHNKTMDILKDSHIEKAKISYFTGFNFSIFICHENEKR